MAEEQLQSVRGRIQFRVRKAGGWGTGVIVPQGAKSYRSGTAFVGLIPEEVEDGDLVELAGFQKEHPRWGDQFEVHAVLVHYPSAGAAVVEWMIERLPNIGPERAQAIVDRWRGQLWDLLESDPQQLTAIPGITPERAEEIHKAYQLHAEERKLVLDFVQLGLTAKQAAKVISTWRGGAMGIVKHNPYQLYTEIEVPFDVVDRIGLRHFKLPKNDSRRVEAFTLMQLEESVRLSGDCMMLRHTLVQSVSSTLQLAYDEVNAQLTSFAVAVYDKYVVLAEVDHAERSVAQKIRSMMAVR